MNKVSVNSNTPSPYLEKETLLYRVRRRLTYQFAFRLIRKYAPQQTSYKLLEIGTGSGYFLAFCRDVMRTTSLYGIEYDKRLLEVTQARAPFAYCVQGNAETFDIESKNFDIIVSFQVIEHLYEPKAMLERIWNHIKPGGLVIITSPNIDGYGAKLMGQSWHGYRDDHVTLKSVNGWTKLITSIGFSCVYSGSTFFSGIPILNRLPLGIVNWSLLFMFGSLPWCKGESYVGVFRRPIKQISQLS